MPGVQVRVSLSEVLEVRGGPLADTEILAFLCVGAEALQDLFLAGQVYNEFGPAFVINPDCIHVTVNSQVEYGSAHKVQQYANYMAPETEEGFVMTSSAVEQMYIYALGKSLIYASEYGLKNEELNMSTRMSKPVKIGDNLESLLGRMTNQNSSQRMPLVKVMEACSLQKERHQRGNKSFSQTLTSLYQSVLGMETEETNLENSPSPSHHGNSPRRSSGDRSRRKRKHSSERGRRKDKYEQKYRSRSHSRSRSRSRSNSKHKGHKREADSPDSGFHRITPLSHSRYSPTPDVGYRRDAHTDNGYQDHHHHRRSERLNNHHHQQPDRQSNHHHHQPDRRTNHLSDITSSVLHNDHQTQARSAINNNNSRPSSRNSSNASSRSSDNQAFKKYLKLKERQRKLRALRLDATDEDASDELSDIVLDQLSETRSAMSAHSQVGTYLPDIHLKYGSSMALKMSRDSDRDSVVSSEASYTPHDTPALRAQADISDPYIQQLQQLTSHPPPPPKFAAQQPISKKQKKKPGSPRTQKPRDFYGPEFVHKTSKPIQRIPMALQGESNKNPAHVCRVVIVLLNGQKLEALVDPSTTGQQLFEAVVTEIELPEFYFFGLTYINDNEHFFITGESKLHKVAPDAWKESWKSPSPVTFTCYLRVKFYVETLSALKHETTRHQLYLQLRRDILEERCLIDEDTALKLAGLALQAEYGDYSRETMGRNYFIPDHYFPGRITKRLGSSYIKDNTPETHQLSAELSQTRAESEFMKIVIERVPEYGIHFHKLLKKKGETSNIIWVGVNINNLVLAENAPNQRIIVHQYPWAAVMKISFNRRRFSVQPRPEFGQLKPVKMNFYTTTYRKGQYLLKFCTAQHSFQLKLKTRLSSLDTIADLSETDHMSIGDTEDMEAAMSDTDTITEDLVQKKENGVSQGFKGTNHVPQKEPRAYRNPPPYRPDSSVSMIEIPTALRELNAVPAFAPPARAATTGEIADESEEEDEEDDEELAAGQLFQSKQAYVIDQSRHPEDLTLSPPSGNETISNTLHQRYQDDLLSPDNSFCEKEVFEVTLPKQKTNGIGICIVGGETSSKEDIGFFVKSVAKNGPAFHDSRIKPGDRIVAINDVGLEGKVHHEAVELIKYSEGHVKLLIAQIKPPGSLKKRDNNDEMFLTKLRESNIHHDQDKEDISSSRSDIEPDPDLSSSIPVITVRTASVHSPSKNDKNKNKNIENELIKKSKKVTDAQCSIPPLDEEYEDQNVENSFTADIHSTLSQVDSLHSEMAVSDIPVDEMDAQDITEVYSESSDTDSDFDTAIDDVIENKPRNKNQQKKPPRRDRLLSPITETVETLLQKKNGSFGLNVTGGVTSTVKHGGIYVKSLIENGSAALEGTIRKGDRILQVNDTHLTGFTHKQAVETLVNASEISRLIIERPVPVNITQAETASAQMVPPGVECLKDAVVSRDSPTAGIHVQELSPSSTLNEDDLQHVAGNQQDNYLFQNEDNTYTIELKKGTYGLGFSLFGSEVEGDTVVRIKRIFPIGPAADCKQIQAGDVIISINGADLKGLTHIESMAVIRRAGKTVNLVMCHPDPEVLPPVLDSYQSLEVTPTSSTSHISDDDDDTDSDSDIEVTPRREALITPPTGFAPSPYPLDEDGTIRPKIASPPPPLPVSPPPVLINSGEIGSSEEFEINVPELNESCESEIVFLQNARLTMQVPSNSSLIVREDSALTVSSRDVTPVVEYSEEISRESTPYTFTESESTTPVNVLEGNSTLTPRDCDKITSDSEQVGSPGDTGSFMQTGNYTGSEPFETDTLNSLNSDLFASQPNQFVDRSDSDSESNADKSTSYSKVKLDTTHTSDVDSVVEVLDNLDYSLQSQETVEYKTTGTIDSDVILNSDNYKINDDNILGLTDENVDVVHSDEDVSESESDYSDDNEEFDDTLKRLEEKYKELNDDFRTEEEEEGVERNVHIVNKKNDVDNDNEIDKCDDNDDDDNYECKEQYTEISSTKVSDNDVISCDNVNCDSDDDNQDGTEEKSEFEDSVAESESVRDLPSLPLQPGDIEVTLTKREGKGLGFTISGGASTTGGCYIKSILQNPALSDGTLRAGDKLIMVNNTDMRSLSHFDAVTVLREADSDVTIRVHREYPSVGRSTGEAGVIKSPYTDSLNHSTYKKTSQDREEDDRLSSPEVPDEEVDSESENNNPLEDSLLSASDGADDMQCIQDLITSLTATDTNLEPTDGPTERRDLISGSHIETCDLSQRSPLSSDMSVYQIDLEKPSNGGLGISLVSTETQNQTGVFIHTIAPGGVADRDGRLQVGDKILQINGESLVGMNHAKAATMLRLSQGKLSLTVSRSQKIKKQSWTQHEEGEESGGEDEEESNRTVDISVTCDPDESSLSITKHVPDDISDDGVDDLVAEAERILRDNDIGHDQNTDQTYSSTDECVLSDNMNKQTKAAHQYLGASEVIEYTPDEIYLDTENSDFPAESDKDLNSGDSDFNEQQPQSRILDKHHLAVEKGPSWDDLRSLDLEVPDEVTSNWLSSIPLVTITNEIRTVLPDIVAELREKIEINEPQQEFKQLRTVPTSEECTDASLQHNKQKNRFRNVLPYNSNRVKISENGETDYINASHIQYDIAGTLCDYIACQGPLPETTDDFWEMMWQQEVTVIAMLTLDMESMKVKCHRYWPDSTHTPLEVCNSKYRLSLLYSNGLDDFDIRNILMEDLTTGESRCLYHVNYTTWPDHGTPPLAVPILQCLRLCHMLRSTGPLTIHCSAGIGRSGTFMTIDLALAHVEKGLKFNISDIVRELRKQRQGMIQTRDQYLFCYTACLECLELEASL